MERENHSGGLSTGSSIGGFIKNIVKQKSVKRLILPVAAALVISVLLPFGWPSSKTEAATQSQTFNTSGTWTAPAGVTSITVEAWGGGSGGGGQQNKNAEGGGGGGAYAKTNSITVIPGNTYSVTVGSGTAPGQGSSYDAGDSYFDSGSQIRAKGGQAATGDSSGGTGGSGTSSIGDIKHSGGNGGVRAGGGSNKGGGGGGASATASANGGNGSNGSGSNGGNGGIGEGNGGKGGNSGQSGVDGSAPGGAGGGKGYGDETTSGHGKNGRVIISWNEVTTGTLTVIKNVTNDNGGSAAPEDFTINVTGGNASPSSFSGSANGTAVTIDANSSYSVAEDSHPGYAASYSQDCSGTMPAGGQKTCTVINDDIQPVLTVTKIVDGGSKVVADFPLFVDQIPVTSGEPNNFNAGTYTVSETGDPDYTASYSGACNSDHIVTLSPGDNVTCTITNSYQTPPPASLTVIKHVINDGVGTSTASDFTMLVDGTNVSNPSFPGSENGTTVTLDAGRYNVTETGPDGYNTQYSEGCSGTIQADAEVTCTVTNDDFPTGSISGSKFNDANNNGSFDTGDSFLSDWHITLHNNNGEGTGNDQTVPTNSDGNYIFPNLPYGTYTVCEVVQDGWVQTHPVNPNCYTIVVNSETPNPDGKDFGNYQTPTGGGEQCSNSIDGTVFNDLNGDGILNGSEPGLSGWKLYLDLDADNHYTVGEPFAITDADGHYHFGPLEDGTYTIREVMFAGWHLNYPNVSDEGEYQITIACEQPQSDVVISAVTTDGTDVNFADAQDQIIQNGGGGGGGGGGGPYPPPTTPGGGEEVRGEQTGNGSGAGNEGVGGEQTLPVTGTSPWTTLVLIVVSLAICAGWRQKNAR